MQLDDDDVTQQIERTRARNRAAQLRFRQRKQAQSDDLQQQVQASHQQLASLQDRHTDLLRRHVQLSTRNADAAVALTAARAAASAATVARTAADSSHSERTAGVAPYCPSQAPCALVPRPLPQTSFYTQKLVPPAAISSFRSCAGVSYDDLRAVAGGGSRLIDFSQHGLSQLLDKFMQQTAARLGHNGPLEEICWFPQLQYEVATGVSLSASATLSSGECLASLALQVLFMRLEVSLISAADSLNHATAPQQDLSTAGEQDFVPLRKSACTPALRPKRTKSPPLATGGSVCSSEQTEDPDAVTRSSGSAGLSRQHSTGGTYKAPPNGWSGRLRCGVNETHDCNAAVRHIMHALVQQFCGLAPVDTVFELLESYHASLLCIIGGINDMHDCAVSTDAHAQHTQQGRAGGVDSEVRVFMVGAIAATQGALRSLEVILAEYVDMRVLRELEVEGRNSPADRRLQRGLEENAHIVLATNAMMHALTQRRDKLGLLPLLSSFRVSPLVEFHEMESMHVHLYRQLRLSQEERLRLIAHRARWRRLMSSLDGHFNRHLAQLRKVACADDLPMALVGRINGVAAGEVAPDAPPSGLQSDPLLSAPRACEVDTIGAQNDMSGLTGTAGGVSGQGGTMLWRQAAHMLGCSGRMTAVAAAALAGLMDVHEMVWRMAREVKAVQLQPGVLLRPLQLATVLGAHVRTGTAPADVLQLCQLADAQQRWRDSWWCPVGACGPLPQNPCSS